jgi:DNA-binding response OmpR family regulator
MRVLIVEDEEVMAEAVAIGLRRSGYAVDLALDGATGFEYATLNEYSVILLDRDLPGMHGDAVCRALIDHQVPARIMMLTAAGDVAQRVSGLNLGADDYLSKPFAFAELLARVSALARRSARAYPPVLRVGDLRMDIPRRLATRGDRDLGLTVKEFAVLQVLAEAPGRYFSAEEILERVWDANADPFTNAVRVTMVGVRRKLGDPGIETLRGVGYRLAIMDAAG